MYDSLCIQHSLSADAIRDLRDGCEPREFEELVQGLMKANYGMDWETWWNLVEWNVRNRGHDIYVENRMDENEENAIVLGILVQWLKTAEAGLLTVLRARVITFQGYLIPNEE
jgi:hypothetical protein